MREIYIKGEMPKSCWECPCFRPNDLEQPCGLDNEDKGYFLDEIDGGECPLKELPQVDLENFTKKEVESLIKDREETIKFLKEQLNQYKSYKTTNERIKDLTNLYSQYKEENQQLKQQLAEKEIIKKALELAVNEDFWLGRKLPKTHKEQVEWFKQEAEKELRNE